MVHEKQNRRICKNCEIEFLLTKRQMRQHKKAIFCSRSCARRHQHAINHKDKRQIKKCDTCHSEFRVTNFDRSRRFCSIRCSSNSRFKKPTEHLEKNMEKLSRMLGDENYYKWLEAQAKKFGFKYGLDHRDLLQDFFLSILQQSSSKFEYVFFDSIRDHYCRGIVGKHNKSEFSDGDLIFNSIHGAKKKFDSFEFVEYLVSLKSMMTEQEYKIVCMLLSGFDKMEIFEKSKDMSRRELSSFYKRINIQNLRLWST